MQSSLNFKNNLSSNYLVKEQGGEQWNGSLINKKELRTWAAETAAEDKGDSLQLNSPLGEQ